jgi:DNA-binding CsgD family transcriptional regulator
MTGRSPKTWRAWTRKEIDRLEALRLDGRTAKEIAAALGRTEASVKCRIGQEQITGMVRGRQRWLELLAAPIPLKEAARIMGVTVGAVKQQKRKLRRLGFEVADLPRANQYGPLLVRSHP